MTRIGIALCHALAAVHSAGIVHGDVRTSTTSEESSESRPSGVRRTLAESHPDLPRAVGDAVVRALAPDPADRFHNLLEMRALLEASIPAAGARAGSAHPAHLPEEVGRFIGREVALLEIRWLVLHDPLVTPVCAGGGGKTRLALRVAAQIHDVFEDGAHWIYLTTAAEGEALAARVAYALCIPDSGNQSAETTLIEHLRHRRVLLVLGNCEHVRAATAEQLDAIIPNCARLQALATSCEDLGLSSEVRFDVTSLTLPEPDSPRDATDDLRSGVCECPNSSWTGRRSPGPVSP